MAKPQADPEVLAWLAGAGDEITLRVAPGAARDALRLEASADGPRLRAAVTAPPEGGKANAAVLKLLARALGLPRSALTLVRGHKHRTKTVRVRR